MEKDKDILQDSRIKENPFKVPEGYFESLESKVDARRGQAEKRTLLGKIAPYAAMAASFVVIALTGSAIVKWSQGRNSEAEAADSYYYSQNVSSQNMSEEDIINYLINADMSVEEINVLSEQ